MKRLLIILVLFALFLRVTAPASGEAVIVAGEVMYEKDVLSWYSIDYWLRVYEVQEIDIVKRQIRLETGNLTSRICLECNNLTGMRKARRRETTAIGRLKYGTAVYRDFRDSLLDYRLWQERYYRGGDYYEFLKSHGYAMDKDYISKLKLLN